MQPRRTNDFPFYLRGYKAIDKEISLIQTRTEEEKLLSTDGYLRIKQQIRLLENDLSSTQLRVASDLIANDNPYEWVEFDLAIADIKMQNNSMLYIALPMFLGGVVGVVYALISDAIRKRKEQMEKV